MRAHASPTDRRASSSATASSSHYEVVRRRRRRRSLLLPTWSIIHSRFWKAQVPYLARHHRVVTFDGRGSGRSDRPVGAAAYTAPRVRRRRARRARRHRRPTGPCSSACRAATLVGRPARRRPSRAGARAGRHRPGRAAWRPSSRAAGVPVRRAARRTPTGWAKYNRHYWRARLPRLPRVLLRPRCSPSRTRPSRSRTASAGGWRSTPRRSSTPTRGLAACGLASFRDGVRSASRCPVLVIHGDEDAHPPARRGRRASPRSPAGRSSRSTAAATARTPATRCIVNRLIEEFVDMVHPAPTRRTWVRAARRPKRALYLSSPIGLGHARRDVAIADELRRHHPDLQIDWLAQHPVTTVLEAARRARPPGVGVAGQRVGPHRGRGGRARPARLPGDPPDGRDPRQQLHGLPRRRRATSTTTS